MSSKQVQNDEMEIDLGKLLKALLHRAWLVILATILGGVVALSYTFFFVTPLYQSGVKMYVNNSSFSVGSASFSISNAELSAAQSLVDTYIVILKTRTVLNEVIEKAGLSYDFEELEKMITAMPINSTEVFEVTITGPDPYEAEKIANTIAAVLPERLSEIVDGSSMRIVDHAVVPAKKFSPSYSQNTLIGALVGLVLCIGVISIRTIMDTVIRSEDYLTTNYPNVPLLAVIPDMDSQSYQKSAYKSGY